MYPVWKAENVKMLTCWTYAFKTEPLACVIIPNFHDFEADVSEYSFI